MNDTESIWNRALAG